MKLNDFCVRGVIQCSHAIAESHGAYCWVDKKNSQAFVIMQFVPINSQPLIVLNSSSSGLGWWAVALSGSVSFYNCCEGKWRKIKNEPTRIWCFQLKSFGRTSSINQFYHARRRASSLLPSKISPTLDVRFDVTIAFVK